MAVSRVHIEADVYMVCLTHALSTELEEIMGLLIGEITDDGTSHISALIILLRSDKRKDRVEISPEQLSAATAKAERLAHQLQRPLRVLGWYHSHPHITVWPSHVDSQTQAMYQMMDQGFIGLIFSVFSDDKSNMQSKIQLICFQAFKQLPDTHPPQYYHVEIPLYIVGSKTMTQPCIESLVELPKILHQEEQAAYSNCFQVKDAVTKLYNGAVYTKAICHLMEILSGPLLQTLENRLICNRESINQLKQERDKLKQEIISLQSSPESSGTT